MVNGQLLAIKSEDEINLRAKKISIDAGDSFTIKCKDSTISINDKGEIIIDSANKFVAQSGTAQVAVKDDFIEIGTSLVNDANPMNSSITVGSVSGVSVEGPNVSISPVSGFTVSDYFGGEFKVAYGQVSSSGIKISDSIINKVDFGFAVAGITKDVIQRIVTATTNEKASKKCERVLMQHLKSLKR